MSSSLPWVSESRCTGRRKEGGREGEKNRRRYGGVSDPGGKLTAGLFNVIAWISFGFFFIVFVLQRLTSKS